MSKLSKVKIRQHMHSLEFKQLSAILNAQSQALQSVVNGEGLIDTLNHICLMLESCFSQQRRYVALALYSDGHLIHHCHPSLSSKEHDLHRYFSDKSKPFDHIQFTSNKSSKWNDSHHVLEAQAIWSQPIFCSKSEFLGRLDVFTARDETPQDIHKALLAHFAQFIAVTVNKDKDQRQQQELHNRLVAANERMEAITHLIPDLMFVLKEDGTIEDLFGGNRSLLTLAIPEFLGKKHQDVLPNGVSSKVQLAVERALEFNQIQIIHYQLNLPIGTTDFEGRIIPAEQDQETMKRRILYMARDVTEQNKDKAEIERLAYFDPLTELANRRLLLEKLDEKISLCRNDRMHGGLIFADLDDFKKINDSLGHSIGDEFLIMIGIRLQQALPENCTLARIGGDEFVVLLDHMDPSREALESLATELAQKILSTFDKAFFYNRIEYRIGCSTGICIFDGIQATTADQVMQQADMCMYQAKKRGGQQLIIYDDTITDFMAQRFQIESEIQKGLKNHAFVALFQPQIGANGEVISAEALIRWHRDGKTIAEPAEFIPIAENSGLINQLQRVVLEQACQLLNQIDVILGHRNFTISINISANQFRTQLGQMLFDTLIHFGLEPSRFKLEITESVLLERSEVVTEQVEIIQAMGFNISIDDFGMGYSSLAYLHDLPVGELKIDKAFVDFGHKQKQKLAIIQSIAQMAHELELDLVIEGIETLEQKDMLNDLNYTAMQGFYFHKPLSSSEFLQIIQAQKS